MDDIISGRSSGATGLEELAALFSTATTWQEVRAEWPANPIQRFIPGTDSGTFGYFVEEIFDDEKAPILGAGNLQQSEDDNVLVQGISGDSCDPADATTACAVGFFGYAYFTENSDRLGVLNVGGVEPNQANADAGDYPLARPLYIYSTAGIMAEKPHVADFINFFLTYVNEEVIDVGYSPASEADLEAARQAWLDAIG